jgi:hypothetical protein
MTVICIDPMALNSAKTVSSIANDYELFDIVVSFGDFNEMGKKKITTPEQSSCAFQPR